jgi:hypothetical protein
MRLFRKNSDNSPPKLPILNRDSFEFSEEQLSLSRVVLRTSLTTDSSPQVVKAVVDSTLSLHQCLDTLFLDCFLMELKSKNELSTMMRDELSVGVCILQRMWESHSKSFHKITRPVLKYADLLTEERRESLESSGPKFSPKLRKRSYSSGSCSPGWSNPEVLTKKISGIGLGERLEEAVLKMCDAALVPDDIMALAFRCSSLLYLLKNF